MSAFNKAKEFEEAAKKAEEEFRAQFAPEPEPEKEAPKPEAEVAAPSEPPAEEPKTEVQTEAEPDPWEKKYKDSLKGMNEAQRKAAEAAKQAEDAQKRAQELEAKLQEALDAAKKVQTSKVHEEPEDDPDFEDMPEVARIAEKKAKALLAKELAEINKRLEAQEEIRRKAEAQTHAERMRADIVSAHPDYDQVVNSEEMVAWINNEAPPIYKAIFEGTVPFVAKDAIAVLNAFKQTTTPTPKAKAAPSAAEVAAPVKAVPNVSTRQPTEKPITEAEIDYFMHNSHRMKPEELAEWDRRLQAIPNKPL